MFLVGATAGRAVAVFGRRNQNAIETAKVSTDPRSGDTRRHHISEKNLQKAVKAAVHGANRRRYISSFFVTGLVHCDSQADDRS